MAKALTTAGRQSATSATSGTILALAPRPRPNAARKLCHASALMIDPCPRALAIHYLLHATPSAEIKLPEISTTTTDEKAQPASTPAK